MHNGRVAAPDDTEDSRTQPDPEDSAPLVIRLSGVAHLSAIGVFVIALIFAGVNIAYLWWLLLAPIVLVFWIRRLRTVVDDDGITAVRTFRTDRVSWADLRHLQFPKWSAARAVTNLGDKVPLPAVGFQDLPAISVRSGGRVPDPFAAYEESLRDEEQ